MKFTIDFNKKEITLTENVNIGELFDILYKMFEGEYKKFNILVEPKVVTEYITIQDNTLFKKPNWWETQPYYSSDINEVSFDVQC